jgi:tRNA-splicing ligase RtcB
VLRAAGLTAAVQIENHHNFAWLEKHGDEELVVHRKGATPAGVGVLGIIPGSMGDPGYVVRGLGNPASLDSASHGAGRRMSRNKARETISGSAMRKYLKERDVELLAGGIDESPQAYKPIAEVMAAQKDLVETVAEFRPRMVLMASDGGSDD